MSDHALIFACTFAALLVGHYIGDFWLQTRRQAVDKALKGWRGRIACVRHVTTLVISKAVILAITASVTDLHVSIVAITTALAVDAASHYWADRRTTLKKLAEALGKGDFYSLGAPRQGHDDNSSLGTGAHALDQTWHIAWIWIAALIAAI